MSSKKNFRGLNKAATHIPEGCDGRECNKDAFSRDVCVADVAPRVQTDQHR